MHNVGISEQTNDVFINKEVNPMSGIQRTALFLTIIGAINWGLIGFFQFDLVASLFGGQESILSRIIYSLVGIKSNLEFALTK